MGIFDRLFRSKREKDRVTIASRGVQTLVELYTRPGILYPSKYETRAEKELMREGTSGSRALADLINELIACRSSDIVSALRIAQGLQATPELIEAARSAASALETTVAPTDCRFTSEIVGVGKVGWTTGTHMKIKDVARDTLDVLSGKKTKEEILGSYMGKQEEEQERRSYVFEMLGDVNHPEKLKQPEIVESLIASLGDFFAEGSMPIPPQLIAKGIRKMGDVAIEPLRQQFLEEDVNRRRGAASALGYIKTDAAADLLGEALEDRHAAVRYYAAEALANLGYVARKQLPVLEKAITKEDDDVTKDEMRRAVKKIKRAIERR